MSSGSRVPIPSSVSKTIQNIKEIAGNHSDEEVYAMLRECGMDPNETAQKLLLQDTFHEVRRKRDNRKENLSNREPADSRWRPGTQVRRSRVGWGNYSSRHMYNDAGDGRNATVGKENGVDRSKGKSAVLTSLLASEETKSKAKALTSSSVAVIANGPADVTYEDSSHNLASELLAESGSNPPEEIFAVGFSKLGIHSSTSDPALGTPLDSWDLRAESIIKCEVGNQWAAVESNVPEVDESVSVVSKDFGGLNQMKKVVSCNTASSELPLSTNEKVASENGNCFMQGKMPNECKGVERSRHSESLQHSSSSTHGDSSCRPSSNHGGPSSRPSSNYGSRTQQFIGSHKVVGPNKEWKPKPTTSNNVLPSGTVGTSEIVVPVTVEGSAWSETTLSASTSEEAPIKLKKKLEELHFSDGQHVIIPNHLHVPEAERTGFSFGSFEAGFGVCTSYAGGPDDDRSSTGLSESSQGLEETAEEPSISNQIASPTVQEGNYPGHPESPKTVSENLSPSEAEANGSFDAVPDHDHSKPNTVIPPEGPQFSVIHTAPNYSGFGLMPPVLGTQLAPFDSSEPQARDGSRHPSFVVQQSFDPSASYYTQYQPGADVDGSFSALLVPGAANKYNGNISVLSTQSGQSSHESGNSVVLSTAGPTPLVAQTAGVLQSTIPMGQQPVPIFRQPAGVISHYPPNYISYNQFYSPFLLPPPTIHHFLSNTAFPQQPSAGNVYPSPATAATSVKFSLPQYKPSTNTGNSTLEMPTSFGPYSSFPSGYGTNTTAITGNLSGNEELATPQYKESHVYTNGQQSEGSAIWIPAPGREISGMQAGSFYNLPQGQHVTFAPTQAGQSAFAGIYHPGQSVAAATIHPLLQQSQTMASALEMVGRPPPSVYQQPQRAQINWTNNY